MIRKWIPMALAVGLLAAVVSGSIVLAGENPKENAETDADEVLVEDGDTSSLSISNPDVTVEGPDELAVRVAEILGMEPQATYDAMAQADAAVQPNSSSSEVDGSEDERDADSMSVEAEGLSYVEYGNRIGAILGVDGLRVAQAVAQAYEELYAVEREIRDTGSGRDAEGKEKSDKHPAESDTDG